MNAQSNPVASLLPPFTTETAILKIRAVEDTWNAPVPEGLARGYSPDCLWRNRSEFLHGCPGVIAFLTRKWTAELDYRLIEDLWAFDGNRIAARFTYESHDASSQWHRAHGIEIWQFDGVVLSRFRHASINDLAFGKEVRPFLWPLGRRPGPHPGLTQIGA